MTYLEAYQYVTKKLTENDISDASHDAWYMMQDITAYKRHEFLMIETNTMPEELLNRYIELTDKRCLHIPLQHLLGYTEFMGLKFYVNDKVLIPRQETELLVEEAGRYVKGQSVLDMCTGSGCIIISLKKLYMASSATGIDISAKALEVAHKNAIENCVEIDLVESNLFNNVLEKYDVIVSNPPYIRSDIIEELMPEVKFHEPRTALDGGMDGLRFYREIAKDAKRYLNSGGRLLFEIGHDQAIDVKNILTINGYVDIMVKKDYSGNDRIISALVQ